MNTNRSNRPWKFLSKLNSAAVGAAISAASLLSFSSGSQCQANIILTNGNSSVTIDPTASAGVENWDINGQNQINQEWFWYRAGSSGPESSIDTLGGTSALYDTTGNGQNDTAVLTYGSSSGLKITVTYRLSGGQSGSKTSDLGETIQIANDGKSSQTYSFFEYENFNLDGLTTGQSASISGKNTATVSGNGWQEQTNVSPVSTDYDANTYPTLLNKLTTTSGYNLPNVATSGPGDEETGFEWTVSIMAGCSYEISGDQIITGPTSQTVPEPVSAAAAAMGLGTLLIVRPRRKLGSL